MIHPIIITIILLFHGSCHSGGCEEKDDDDDNDDHSFSIQKTCRCRVLAGGFPSSFFHDDDMDAWYGTAINVDKAKQDVSKSFQTIFRYYNV